MKYMFKAFIDQCRWRRFNPNNVGTLLVVALSVFTLLFVSSTPKICQDAECAEPKVTAAVCFSWAQTEICHHTLNVSALFPHMHLKSCVGDSWKSSHVGLKLFADVFFIGSVWCFSRSCSWLFPPILSRRMSVSAKAIILPSSLSVSLNVLICTVRACVLVLLSDSEPEHSQLLHVAFDGGQRSPHSIPESVL